MYLAMVFGAGASAAAAYAYRAYHAVPDEALSVSSHTPPFKDEKLDVGLLKLINADRDSVIYCKWDTEAMNKPQQERYEQSLRDVEVVCMGAEALSVSHPDLVQKVEAAAGHVAFKVAALALAGKPSPTSKDRLEALRSALCVYRYKDLSKKGFDTVAAEADKFFEALEAK